MATCPLFQQGTLRIIAAITQGQAIGEILRHLKRPANDVPLPTVEVPVGVPGVLIDLT